ncbi:hypothetical protein [Agrobacterium tumefaciens]|uniref:hypothetical protein n=1 Tax=Agrobacterium tumefaciens TaxID=358 RepID=UPI0021D05D3F|nr:hypothetical protein [Agrobacterium tumefaciens]UXT96749.1 hypothetical protein FY129_04435 [Agrobacterium tumefaciens]
MNYERYLFVERLFQSVQASQNQNLDECIASHERLAAIVELAFGANQTTSIRDLVAAARAAAKRYGDAKNGKFALVVIYQLAHEELEEIASKNSSSLWGYISPLLAGYRLNLRDTENTKNPLTEEELISLISWRTMSSGPESIHSIIQPKLEIFERDAGAKIQELHGTVSDYGKLFDDQKLLHAQASEATAKAQMELATTSHDFEQKALELEERTDAINGDIRQLRADLDAQVAKFGTEAARKLWGQREKQSQIALVVSSVAIFLMIAGPIALAVCMTPEVLHYLAQIVAASALPTIDNAGQPLPTPSEAQVTIAAIGRLVIVTVPIFLYVWAIRLVVRFNSRSLMLLDDARMRLTMLDTFFHLIAKEGAVKEDRALVLNALFRPAPGHGDNVEPPNFTELVTKAIGPSPGK